MKIKLIFLIVLIFCSTAFTQDENKPDESVKATKVVAGAASSAPSVSAIPQIPKLGSPAAKITSLEWVKNGPVEIKKGSIYVVEFWATWCGPCMTSIPHLTEVQKKYKDKNVTIIGISRETANVVKPFVKKMGKKMDYAVAIDTDGSAYEGFMKAYQRRGIPSAFIINKEGNIAWYGHPMADLEEVLGKIIDGSFDIEQYAKQKEEQEKNDPVLARRRKLQNYLKTAAAGKTDEAKKLGQLLLEENDVGTLYGLAIGSAFQLKNEQRDMRLAVDAAKKANELTQYKEPALLTLYAQVLYESSLQDLKDAINSCEKSLELVKDDKKAEAAVRQLLEKYKSALETLQEDKKTEQ